MQIQSLFNHTVELFDKLRDFLFPADKIISNYFKERHYLGSKDRKFISQNVYYLIRNLIQIETIAKQNLKEEHPSTELLCAISLLKNIKSEENILFVKEKFNFDEKTIDDISLFEESDNLSIKYSFPEWMISKFRSVINEKDLHSFLNSINGQASTVIRIIAKDRTDEIMSSFKNKNIELERTKIAPNAFTISKRTNFDEFQEFRDGYFEVQDEGSQIVTYLTEPSEEKVILDVCAGGGGKSLFISDLMNNCGTVLAYDTNQFRLKSILKRIKNEQYSNIKIISESDLRKYENKVDVLLIDAPCTGSGTIRRNPDLKFRLKESDILKYAEMQTNILNEYKSLVKENGKIVYITCSIFREENESVIEDFISKNNFEIENYLQILQKYIPTELLASFGSSNKFLRLFPHLHGTDGFFGCIMRKIANYPSS